MEMDKISDQLGEVGAEKLREESLAKTMVLDSLRKVNPKQLDKTQQEKLEIDKLAQELHAKSEEICEIRQLYEELQTSLHRKDLFLQQISSASKRLQAEYSEKILKLEGENRDLVLSLDEALARILDLEKKTCASSEEIAGLKRLLSIKQEKNYEVKKNASMDLKERDEYIVKLEEDNRISQDRLKWKNEQFLHLEEAHKKLQTQFQVSKLEWQKEKFSLVDEISSVQATLDAQILVSESLGTQLRMSNQALSHEESRRKVLEIQVSECRSKFENVFFECEVAKADIEQLTMKRDEEIAELRVLLRKKEILANEAKYKIQQLEQEKSDLRVALKDFQDAQLNNNATSSLKKLRNKLRGLEQLHSKCAINLKEKESEWNSQIEKLSGDMNHCLSELAVKNGSIKELQKELDDCQCQLEVKSEEIFSLIMVLKSELYVAYSKMYGANEKLEMGIMQIEEKNMFLDQQLQLKNSELLKVHAELKQRSEEVAVLVERVDSLQTLNKKENLMEEELRRREAMLDESNECRSRLEQQLLEFKNTQRVNIKNALEMVNSELAEKASEIEKCKLELQMSKSDVDILKLNLQENQKAHKQEIGNLLVNVKDKDIKIDKLQEQISVLESVILAKSEAAEMLNHEKYNYIRLAEDRNCIIENLHDEIAELKNKLAEREAANSALSVAHNTLATENERFSSSIKEKDNKIQELQKECESLNQEFQSALISLARKELMLDEALKTAKDQKILLIEEKNQVIADLEKEASSLREAVEFQEKSLLQSKQVALQLEETKKSELQELRSQLDNEKRYFEGLLEELESHKQALLNDRRKDKIDKENLLAQLERVFGQIADFCREDEELNQLMGMLGKLPHFSEEDSEPVRNLLSDGLSNTTFSPSRKSVQVSLDKRAPLTELNS